MISFIVPAHNEEALIGRCLEAIAASAMAVEVAHEVIVVDDASTDATASIAAHHGALLIPVTHRKISATRNTGGHRAQGSLFFFVDADTVVNAGVVGSAMRAIEQGAVAGGAIPEFEGWLPWWFRVLYPFMVFVMRRMVNQTGGACLFCTRAVFETTGGFSEEHYAAEEDVWVKALKKHGRFVLVPETVLTSGRSLRNNTPGTLARLLVKLVFKGPDGFRNREGLDLWYKPFREK